MRTTPRTAITNFVNVGGSQPPDEPPDEPFTVATIRMAVEKLQENEVPPMPCPRCGARHYFLISGEYAPTHWICSSCERINRCRDWQPGERGCIANNSGGSVVLDAARATPI